MNTLRKISVIRPSLQSFVLNRTQFCLANTNLCKFSSTSSSNAQKKYKHEAKVTLLGQNDSITITTLVEAQKLAKRRDLHLLKIQDLDTKTQRPVYKLATAAEVLETELADLKVDKNASSLKEKSDLKKSEKSLTIGSRITDHDLGSRLKNISKWLVKRHEVRILINCGSDDMTSGETIYQSIEQSIKGPPAVGKIVQKRSKDSAIKFIILPVEPSSATA